MQHKHCTQAGPGGRELECEWKGARWREGRSDGWRAKGERERSSNVKCHVMIIKSDHMTEITLYT